MLDTHQPHCPLNDFSAFTVLRVYGICNCDWRLLLAVALLAFINPIMTVVRLSESSVHIAIPKYADTPRPKLVNEGPRVQGGPINGCIVENSSFDASLGRVLMRV